jgi:hypothetical protein
MYLDAIGDCVINTIDKFELRQSYTSSVKEGKKRAKQQWNRAQALLMAKPLFLQSNVNGTLRRYEKFLSTL